MTRDDFPGIWDDSPSTKSGQAARYKTHVFLRNGRGWHESDMIDVPVGGRDSAAVVVAIRNSKAGRHVWAFFFADVLDATVIAAEAGAHNHSVFMGNLSPMYWLDAEELDLAKAKQYFGRFSNSLRLVKRQKAFGLRAVLCRNGTAKKMSDGDIVLEAA